MSDVLRSTTFQLAFNGNDGLTGIRTFTKSVRDADAVVKELNDKLGQNATATYKTVQSKKELEQQARLIANQFERNAKRADELTRSLQHQISIIGKNAEQQAAMNAAFSLGATATEEQKNKVSQLAAQLAMVQAEERAVLEASNARIAAQAELNRQIEQAEQRHRELSAELRRQISIIGESNEKQEISNNLKRLGSDATDEQRRSIIELTNRLTRLKAEQAALAEAEKIANQEKQRATANALKLTQQYQFLASTVGKTADEIEQMNAVQALGSRATEAQRQQVLQAVQQYQQLRGAVDGGQGSLRNFRGQMQNLGWQVQDTVVQLQMGTSAFVVLSQQGSQLASAMGPTGALVGAGIAVAGVIGGTLYQALNSSAGAMERLDKINKEYGKYVTVSAEGTTELSAKLEELAIYSKRAADEQLRLSRSKVLEGQAESIKVISQQLKDIKPFGGNLREALGLGSVNNLIEFRAAIRELGTEINPTNLDRYLKAIALINPEAKGAEKGALDLKQALLDQFYELSRGQEILKDTADGWEPISKAATETVDEIIKAFESEYNSLIKQTENTQQEYSRRKKIIDDYVAHIGKTDQKAKESYAALDQWKSTQLDKEFQKFYSQIVKKTNTTEQEYDRQKAIIDDHVKRVGFIDTQAADAYAALEQWKTDIFAKEYDKRERVRRQIEQAQIKVRSGDDPFGAENQLFLRNVQLLVDQRKKLGEDQLTEQQRIDQLLEQEAIRHNTVMDQLTLESYQNQIALYGMASQQLTAIADLMATGAADVQNRVREMNDFQKAMFLVSQAVAAATAFINGVSLGTKLAEMFPLVAPQMIALGTGIGAASAGAIAGVTIAGAFDNGGDVPAGQFGIVSEYGDELVNGMLVKGPARVTSRKETERMMSGSGVTSVSLKVNIDNQIPNAQYDVQQLSVDEVRIIARQEFNKNIDQGVSSALSNPNSKAAKSMRRNYKAPSRL